MSTPTDEITTTQDAPKSAPQPRRLPPNPNFFTVLNNPVNRSVQAKFWFTTIVMFTLPIFVYFACHDYIFDGLVFELTPIQRLSWSGVAAVVAANIIVIAYVYMALATEEDKPRSANHEKELAALSKRMRQQYGHEEVIEEEKKDQ